jgi:hypothetical protein
MLALAIVLAIFAAAHGDGPSAAAAPQLQKEDVRLRLYVYGTGTGRIESAPAGISCETSCQAMFPRGTTVTLTATPTNGSSIRYWQDRTCREQANSLEAYTGTTCTLVMDAAKDISITFNQAPRLRLFFYGTGSARITSSPAGISCTASCEARFPTGTTVTLTVKLQAGSSIRYWQNDACREQGKNLNTYAGKTCTFVIDQDRDVSITFYPAPTLRVYISGAGRVVSSPPGVSCTESCRASFPTGTTLTLRATPKPGSTLYGWDSGLCKEQGTKLEAHRGPTCTFTLDADKSINVSFVAAPKLEPAKTVVDPPAPGATNGVAVSVSGNGTVAGSIAGTPGILCGVRGFRCYAQAKPGTRVTLRANPAAGSVFLGWSGACSGKAAACTVTAGRAGGAGAAFAARNKQERIDARLDRSTFDVRWHESVATGSLLLRGFVAKPSRLRIELRRPRGDPLLSADLRASGAFAYTLRFSPELRLLPGGFVVSVTGAAEGITLPPQLHALALTAPPEGVVGDAYVSRKQHGRPVPFVPAPATEVWATFVFEAQPKPGRPLTVRWYRPDGKFLGQVEKPPGRASVSSFMHGSPRLPIGAWRAELRVGATIVKQLRVQVGCAKC